MDDDSGPDAIRPSSPAQSDATEVPDLPQRPQSLAGEIDHIKTLISRSATSSRPPENSITAQVFRTRSGSTGGNAQVSQQRLFHELDHLKKRIKHEHVLVRRPSQIDPETESESGDTVDEREEELENMRDRLVQERSQNEDLLSAAEDRIDSLANERDDLSDLLEASREELAKMKQLKADVDSALAESNRKIKDLEEKSKFAKEEVERLTAEHGRTLGDLQSGHNVEAISDASAGAHQRHENVKGQSANDAEDLAIRLTIEQQENDSLRAQLETKEELHQKEMRSAEERIAQMAQTLAEFEQRATNAEVSLKNKEEELVEELAAKEHEVVDAHRELSELHKKLYDPPFQLQGNNAELSQATTETHTLSSLKAGLANAVERCEIISKGWADEMTRRNADQKDLLSELQKGWSSEAEQAGKAHIAELSSTRDNLQKEIADIRASSDRRIASMSEVHAEELVEVSEAFRMQLQSANNVVESSKAKLASVNEQHWKQLLQFQEKYKTLAASYAAEKATLEEEQQNKLDEVWAKNSKLEAQLTELKAQREGSPEIVDQDGDAIELKHVRMEHDRAVQSMTENHKIELATAREFHRRQLSDLGSALRAEKAVEIAAHSSKTQLEQKEALDRALNDLQESSQSEIAALKKSHKKELSRVHATAEKELADALANADDDLDERLRAQSKAHRKELDKLHESLNIELTKLHVQLEEASQLRQTHIDEAETQHHAALADLGERLHSAEQANLAFQTRLDAELNGRAEAERSLASFKKQKFEEDRTNLETKDALQKTILALELERDNLKTSIEASPNLSGTDPQEKEKDMSGSTNSSEDITVLKERLATAQQERDDIQNFTEKRVDEVARQNKFLIKELETIMAQRSTETTTNQQNDAWVQTEPIQFTEKNIEPGPIYEPKADMATSQAAKRQRHSSNFPVIALSEFDEKRKSFEDYLLKAQAELAGLGGDMNANEELFIEKIEEHLSDLTSAKEELSVEFERKFTALLTEKGRMERAVSAKNAADFIRERDELLARYGIRHQEPAKQLAMFLSLPSRKQKAFRNAEERLVAEYTRRVTKRRSQIAVKHAEKFSVLTQDYNRRLTEVFKGKSSHGSDAPSVQESQYASADAEATEALLEREETEDPQHNAHQALTASDAVEQNQLENATLTAADSTPKSRLPQRISISKPRTPTSIPRAVPYRGNWAGTDQTSPAQNSSTDDRLTDKKTSSGESPFNQLTDASESSGTITPGIVEAFRRLSLDPNDSERDSVRGDSRNLTPEPAKPQRPRPTRMRHSSRAIFGFQASDS